MADNGNQDLARVILLVVLATPVAFALKQCGNQPEPAAAPPPLVNPSSVPRLPERMTDGSGNAYDCTRSGDACICR